MDRVSHSENMFSQNRNQSAINAHVQNQDFVSGLSRNGSAAGRVDDSRGLAKAAQVLYEAHVWLIYELIPHTLYEGHT